MIRVLRFQGFTDLVSAAETMPNSIWKEAEGSEMKRDETKQKERKRNETKRSETKWTGTIGGFRVLRFQGCRIIEH